MLKSILDFAVKNPVGHRLISSLEHSGNGAGYRCQILTYHRVEDVEGFAEQMAYVAHHYDVLSMDELLDAARSGAKLPPRALLITFDDAYRNFAECAWPILESYRLPVTVFVPTAFPGPARAFWWDRLSDALKHTSRRSELQTPTGVFSLRTAEQRRRALRRLKEYCWSLAPDEVDQVVESVVRALEVDSTPSRVLTWDQLRSLAAAGVTLGAHTRTHPNLAQLSQAEMQAEVTGSLEDLQREVGTVLPIFAYPGGYYNEACVHAARSAGIELAFTTCRGANDIRQRSDWLTMRRNNVGPAATLPVLRARLLQAAPSMNRIKQLVRLC